MSVDRSLQLQFLRRHMCKYLHLEDDSEAYDKSQELYMFENRLLRFNTKFFFRIDLIIKLKSSAYAQKSISLCNPRIEHNLLYATRKIITENPVGLHYVVEK